MSRYRMDDGTVVNTEKCRQSWDEATRWDGRNHISVPTGSQWNHQQLYMSRKGRFYIVSWSQWQGSTPSAEWVSHDEATRWLLVNDHELPDCLQEHVEDVEE